MVDQDAYDRLVRPFRTPRATPRPGEWHGGMGDVYEDPAPDWVWKLTAALQPRVVNAFERTEQIIQKLLLWCQSTGDPALHSERMQNMLSKDFPGNHFDPSVQLHTMFRYAIAMGAPIDLPVMTMHRVVHVCRRWGSPCPYWAWQLTHALDMHEQRGHVNWENRCMQVLVWCSKEKPEERVAASLMVLEANTVTVHTHGRTARAPAGADGLWTWLALQGADIDAHVPYRTVAT